MSYILKSYRTAYLPFLINVALEWPLIIRIRFAVLVPLYFIHDHAYNFKWKIQWNRGEEKQNKYDIALVDLTYHKSRILAQKFVKTASVHVRKQYQICSNILKIWFPVQISSSDTPWCHQWITFSEIKERKSVKINCNYIYPGWSYLSK